MCGIFGYIGSDDASKVILEGLKRLEYRGYDSWGVAVVDKNNIKVAKKVGPIGDFSDLKDLPESNIGIGHTRWATHGGVTELNAHPHFASDDSFVLAQNGIVENYQELKKMLIEKGYEFKSQTDTEVIVHLVEEKLKTIPDITDAVRAAFLDLTGRNTIILLSSSGDHVVAVRHGSPLVIGIGPSTESGQVKEYFFASDTLSFANKTNKVMFVNDHEMVEYVKGELKVYNVKSGQELEVKISELDHEDVTIDKEGYEHFMMKEIVEQKYTIREAVQYNEEELKPLVEAIKSAETVYTVGAGTASFAAGQIAFYLRKYAGIKAIELKSYEMKSFKELFSDKDIIIAVSQSGETSDTIEALEMAREKGVTIASIVNMVGSTTTRMSKHQYFSRSGPEICVASTKAFTAQISWGLTLAYSVIGKQYEAKEKIETLAGELEKYFTDEILESIQKIVDDIIDREHFFVLGKGQNFYVALEGALKIKEISYKHFEGFAAGELKHGVIALIEEGTPVFVIVSNDEDKHDMLTAAAEVKARGAKVIAIGKETNELFAHFIPTIDAGIADPIANVIPFQLISYYMGTKLGHNPDKPRNLAKSVTVK